MELSIYDVIKKIVTTSKSVGLRKKLGQITLQVHTYSNKILIKTAVEKIWNVKVDKVRVISVPGKQKTVARRTFQMPTTKKAIITLKPGYAIDLPDQIETMGLANSGTSESRVAGES